MSRGLIPVHVGLMGHIDHGKTALARAISDVISTAGLDKHPQSQKRGITIDLGFTMFELDKYLVTLVDAPGHADLIRSVVAGAQIIDTAILVVAADEGPMIQTGEHIVVLESMGISSLVVAITKTDLVAESVLDDVESRVRSILDSTKIRTIEYVRVSASNGTGIADLKDALCRVITPRERDVNGPLLMPIDHAFPVKGHGTVVTGTILRGSIRTGDAIEFSPQGLTTKIRSIQTFGQSREGAQAGDRVGLNVPNIDHSQISRGDYACSPGSLQKANKAIILFRRNTLYRGRITPRMVVSASVGMPTTTAQLIPIAEDPEGDIAVDDMSGKDGKVALLLKTSVPTTLGTHVLLMRTDLSPSQMRIMGSGEIIALPTAIKLRRRRVRTGTVQRIRESDCLVEGLASRKAIAESLLGFKISTPSGAVGIIREPFGTRGVVSVTFDRPVSAGEGVHLELFKLEEYTFGE